MREANLPLEDIPETMPLAFLTSRDLVPDSSQPTFYF